MAWPTPALDDLIVTHDTGGKRWLHALCLAINERQAGLGLGMTQFYKASSAQGYFLSLDDFTNMWITGPNGYAIKNLNLCMVALKAMLTQTTVIGTSGQFLQSPGYGATAWSLAALQAEVGLGVFPASTTKWNDLNFWKQIQGALDRMTICRKVCPSGAATIQEQIGDTPELAAADAPSSIYTKIATGWFLEGFSFGPFSSSYYYIFRNNARTFFTNACATTNTMDEAYYVIQNLSSSVAPGWQIGKTGGAMVSVPNNFSGHKITSDLEFASGNQTDIKYTAALLPFTTSPPTITGGGPPFYGAFSGWWCSMAVPYADLYFRPELTDQA